MSVLGSTRAGGVTRLTLNRPDKANALDAALVEALHDALDSAFTDGTRLVVIAGEGRNLSAGFDFGGFETATEGDLLWRFVRIEQLLQKLYHAPCPTLAFAHGRNFGAGADLFVACDTRVAAPSTTFRMPGLRFGLQLGTRRLAQRIGTESARSLLAGTRAIGNAEAMAIRFLTTTAPASEWDEIIERESRVAGELTPDATVRLRAATVVDTRAQDLSDLVASVTPRGLKDRIARYRAGP